MKRLYNFMFLVLTLMSTMAISHAEGIKVIIENRAPANGTWTTPFWVGFHNGTFDTYTNSSAASIELENLAEDGNIDPLLTFFESSGQGNVQGVIASGAVPPFAPGETAEMTFIMDGNDPDNRYFSYGAMVLPSNDAFIGNDSPTAHQIFDGSGNFLGASFAIYGTVVRDAGTEVNDEIPAHTAFFGQMTPNTGVDEDGVVHDHPGYLPVGSGGILDDPMFAGADFTQGGYEMARITIIRSDTPVSGNVSGVWDIGGSPYLLDGDVTVPAGETLTIEPGVVVFAQSWYYFAVQGTLLAIGTEADSILFTSTPHGPGEPAWRSIHFENADLSSEMAYCIVENVHATAAAPYNQGAIHIDNSSPTIRNSSIRNNETDSGGGLYIAGGSAPTLLDNDILYNSSKYGGGIYSIDSTPSIIGNKISGNSASAYGGFSPVTARGGGIYLTSCDGSEITHNLITGNSVHAEGNVGSHASGGGIHCGSSDATILNNTISGNSSTLYASGSEGGGINLYYSNTAVINNIVDNNIGGGVHFTSGSGGSFLRTNDFYGNDVDFLGIVPANLGQIVTTNYNGDPADQFLNIFLDPLYVNAAGGDFHLQSGSPAIDAGDPTTPNDPDGTIADIGAFYYDQGGMIDLTIDLTYVSGSPVPETGGNLTFGVFIENTGTVALNFDAWLAISYEGGTAITVVQRPFSDFQPGWTINRPNMFYPIPSTYAAGDYMFYGRVGIEPNIVWDESGFPFSKAGANFVENFEPFAVDGAPNPFDRVYSDQDVTAPSTYALEGAFPNPFNPTTTIRFAIPEEAKVTLTVFDVQGRQIAELVNSFRQAGSHNVTFDASNLASGVYLYRLEMSGSGTT
ncbi:MAG: spondin domain-containing protein, partial [bacterium]